MEIIKEREATNTEFNETKQLVEAVLERLTFHAFEEVLIWSNEHASRALTRCLKKTLEEFENGELVLTSSYPKLKNFSIDNVVKGLMTTIDQAQERQDNLNKEIEELTSQLAKSQTTPEGFVLVDQKHTEDWYLDDQEGMWWDVDGIDNSLCDLDPGQVQAVEHKEYLITESNTVYAAKVWDESNDQVGFWEFFKTKDEAEKTAAYCKAKFKGEQIEAQEQSHD